jgi:hypothetical protein
MTNSNNQWIGDFHKALEERKEPKPEPDKPSPAPFPRVPTLADWVKQMGGGIGPKGDKPAALDNGPASILRAQVTAADWPWRIIRNGA